MVGLTFGSMLTPRCQAWTDIRIDGRLFAHNLGAGPSKLHEIASFFLIDKRPKRVGKRSHGECGATVTREGGKFLSEC